MCYRNIFISDSKAKNRVSGYILMENGVIITLLPNRVSGCILIENLYSHSISHNCVSGYILKHYSIKYE